MKIFFSLFILVIAKFSRRSTFDIYTNLFRDFNSGVSTWPLLRLISRRNIQETFPTSLWWTSKYWCLLVIEKQHFLFQIEKGWYCLVLALELSMHNHEPALRWDTVAFSPLRKETIKASTIGHDANFPICDNYSGTSRRFFFWVTQLK